MYKIEELTSDRRYQDEPANVQKCPSGIGADGPGGARQDTQVGTGDVMEKLDAVIERVQKEFIPASVGKFDWRRITERRLEDASNCLRVGEPEAAARHFVTAAAVCLVAARTLSSQEATYERTIMGVRMKVKRGDPCSVTVYRDETPLLRHTAETLEEALEGATRKAQDESGRVYWAVNNLSVEEA